MNIKKKYIEIFIKSLSINKKDFREDLNLVSRLSGTQ